MDEVKRFELELGDGYYLELPEWDDWARQYEWTFDPDTQQAVRYHEGKKVFLFHEILRLSPDRDRDLTSWAVLDDASLGKMLNSSEELNGFYLSWGLLLHRASAEGIRVGPPEEVLGLLLTRALGMFFDWRSRGETLRYEVDESGLTPGRLVSEPLVEMRHVTLAGWMDEWDDWVADDEAPVGLAPCRYSHSVLDEGCQIILTMLEGDNDGLTYDRIFEIFEGEGLLTSLVGQAVLAMGNYPVPLPI